MPIPEFPRALLDAYTKSWQREHQDVMKGWDLGARLQISLSLFDHIRSLDNHWSEEVRRGEKELEQQAVQELVSLYQAWLSPSEIIRGLIRRMEVRGFAVQKASRFRSACREAKFKVEVDLRDVLKAEKQLDAGKGRILEQVPHEVPQGHSVTVGRSALRRPSIGSQRKSKAPSKSAPRGGLRREERKRNGAVPKGADVSV